jgi:hypothetical protein
MLTFQFLSSAAILTLLTGNLARISLPHSVIVVVFDDQRKQVTAESNPAVASIINLDKYTTEPVHSITCDPSSWWKDRKTSHPRHCVVLWPPQFPAKYYF